MFVNLLLEVVYQYRCVGNVAENQNASFHPGDDAFPEKDTEQPKQDAGPTSTHKSKLVMPVRRSGVMEAEQPSTKNILKRLLPMTFPMAISGFFFKAATMEVASSGNEVPPATSVRPMMDSLTPNPRAMPLAPSTKKLPPMMSRQVRRECIGRTSTRVTA